MPGDSGSRGPGALTGPSGAGVSLGGWEGFSVGPRRDALGDKSDGLGLVALP
jgi:hypothetical protein